MKRLLNVNGIRKREPALFWGSILVVAAVNLWFFLSLNLFAIATAGYDDGLFVHQARSLLQGNWLGDYGYTTLIKGCFYPVFIALSHLTGIPLLMTQHVVYLLSGVTMAWIMRNRYVCDGMKERSPCGTRNIRYMSAGMIFLGFWVFAFNPSMTWHPSLRVIRDPLYASQTVFIFSVLLGMLFAYEKNGRVIRWGILLGTALIPFWLTREEGIWIIPSVLGVYFYMFCHCLVRRRGSGVSRVAISLLIAFSLLFSGLKSVETVNRLKYGVAVNTEFQADDFKAAYGALTRVKHESFRRYVPVPREARERIYRVSPAFSELRPFLEGPASKKWISAGEKYISPNDDLSSHFSWAFREAVTLAGHHRTALDAREYYMRLAGEVNGACDRGELAAHGPRCTMAPVFRNAYIGLTLEKLWESIQYVARFDYPVALNIPNVGTASQLKLFEEITNHPLTSQGPTATVSGWVFSPGRNLALGLAHKGESAPYRLVEFKESDDVYGDHKGTLPERELQGARQCRFTFTSSVPGRELIVFQDGEPLHRIDIAGLEGAAGKGGSGELYFHIDASVFSYPEKRVLKEQRLRILRIIGGYYRDIVPFLLVAGILALVMVAAWRSVSSLTVFNVLMLGGILCRHVLLSYLDVTTFGGINENYHQPTFVLTLLFAMLSIFDFVRAASLRYKMNQPLEGKLRDGSKIS